MGGKSMAETHEWTLPAGDILPDDRTMIITQAEACLGKEFPMIPLSLYLAYTRNGERAEFEKRYFTRRRMLSSLVLGEWVEKQGRFLDQIMDGLWMMLEETTWCLPAHNLHVRDTDVMPFPDPHDPVIDLCAAESGATLSTAAVLLGDALPKEIRKRINEEIHQRIVVPYLSKDFWWMARGENPRPVNWSPWCTQNVLLSVFQTDTTNAERKKAVAIATKTLSVYFDLFPDDGCCSEGAEYYRRSALCLFFALEILDQVEGGALSDVWENDKLQRMADFIVSMHVNGRYFFNWGDCSACTGLSGVREYLFGKAMKSAPLMAFSRRQLELSTPEERLLTSESDLFIRYLALVKSDEALKDQTDAPEPDWVEYPSCRLFVSKQGNLAVSLKASANGGSHQHNDGGSVIVFKEGEPLLIDIGVETYTKLTFSPQRYTIWTMRSPWHNVANPEGGEQSSDGKEPPLVQHGKVITMDLSGLYPAKEGFSYHRTVDMSESLQVMDEMDGAEGILTLVSQEKPSVQGNTLQFGTLGAVETEGMDSATVEEIPVTDPRLQRAWHGSIWRTLVRFSGTIRWKVV
jgi:hypothetical protein